MDTHYRLVYDPACNVVGNTLINSGEKNYHVKGQKYYEPTVISYRYGSGGFAPKRKHAPLAGDARDDHDQA
jgi:hypothetical protein